MTIQTKFSIGQDVYALFQGTIIKMQVKHLDIRIEEGEQHMTYGMHKNPKCSACKKVFREHELFESPEAVAKSLVGKIVE